MPEIATPHHVVFVKRLDERHYVFDPSLHQRSRHDVVVLLVVIRCVRLIRQLQCEDGGVLAVGHIGDGVHPGQNLGDVVLVCLRARAVLASDCMATTIMTCINLVGCLAGGSILGDGGFVRLQAPNQLAAGHVSRIWACSLHCIGSYKADHEQQWCADCMPGTHERLNS